MTEHSIDLALLKPYGQTFSKTRDDLFLFSSEKEQPFNTCKETRNSKRWQRSLKITTDNDDVLKIAIVANDKFKRKSHSPLL